MKKENDLGRDEIGALVWRTALPSMLAQFVSVLYSIVDRMYIGHIAGVGETALAGVGVCGPVVTMVGSAAVWISWGASPLMGIRMGEGRPEEARRILRTGFCMLLAFSLAMMALVIPLREPMLRFFGASDATYPYADAYFTVYLTGTVFALLAAGLNQMIIAQGFAAQAMRLVVLGAALNIALDPVFIFALNMGVRGAALATVLSQMASAAGAVIFLRGRRAAIRLERGGLSLPAAQKILTLGFTPFAIIAIDNVMLIAMNAVLQRYGGALITACERNKMRAERLEYNVKKQGASRVTVMNMDARQLDDFFAFDRVLLDAPCSGSGTVTEGSRGQFSREYLDRTVKMQKTLLDKAIRLLKPGHELVYSTCSVLREENEEVVVAALKKGGVQLVPIDTAAFDGVPLLPTDMPGVMCVCPDEWYEGFFVAKMKKNANTKK